MLTTIDNPFNPHTDWDEWYAFDERAGYHTSGYIARIARTSDDLSEADQELAIDNAQNEIMKQNVLGIYRLVEEPSE